MSSSVPPLPVARPAHHRPGGGFQNPWPGAHAHGAGDMARWMAERWRNPPPPNPPASAMIRATPSFRTPRAAAGALTVTWVGHSTFLVQLGALNVLTDP